MIAPPGKWKGGVKRPIIITRPDGSEVEYESQSAAAKVEPLFQTYISAMCTGKVAMCAGFKARFKEVAYEDPETKTYRETGI